MALVTDFLNFLGTTWSKYSVYTQSYSGNYGPTLKHAKKAPVQVQAAKTLRQRSVQEKTPGTYSLEDVASHDRPGDCWIAIKEKVYDISRFADEHPGGTVISTYFGRDGTDVFSTFHPPSAWKQLNDFYIGDLAREVPLDGLLKDYREMRARYVRDGLFKSSKGWFLLQFLINTAIFSASIAVICYNNSYAAILLSSCLMGLFIQQCGWMAHDFLHQQVFEDRAANTFFGYLFGNCVLGFSVSWWTTKHNIHHTAPNECDETYTPLDEDIDTLPIIAWSKDILATVQSKRILRVLQYQHLLLVPLLFLARYSWTFGSMLFTFNPDLSPTKSFVEKATVLFHYTWFSWAAFHILPGIAKPFAWMATSELVGGFLLGFVFTLSHNGKEVYNESKDFVRAQVVTTRNTKRGWFNDWFTGGLDTQIEHHLFPTMPRHNYPKIAPEVQALCEKHGLEYDNMSVVGASLAVLQATKEIAEEATVRLHAE